MRRDFQPQLDPVRIASLRPTQMTVGFREVERKRLAWRKRAEVDGPDFLGRHMVPAVIGPGRHYFLIDQHHLLRALHEEGVSHVLVSVVADLGGLAKPLFWTFMDKRNWLHPFDAEGERHDHDRIPKKIGDLTDDPYRSIAGELRRCGGYAKVDTPYSEFLWADFMRRRIPRKLVDKAFERALGKALDLAHHKDADYLPGWCGREDG
jgi:hypothetical protein